MLVAIKFIEGLYYHELARALRRFGYEIDNKPRGDFDVKGVAPTLIDKFSKRHQEIDRKTRELLEREPEKANGNIAAIREHIAHKERARKIRNISLPELQATWDAQLTPAEKTSLRHLTTGQPAPALSSETLARQAVSWAEEHVLERRSVVQEHELWRHALEHVRGQSIGLADVQAVTRQRGYLRDEKHPGKVTTKELLRREWDIVCMARDGIGRFGPHCSSHSIQNSELDAEQRQAVEHILRSRDFVTLFRGGAGTGKSYTLREVYGALQQAGHGVEVIAPQRQQVMDLERDGFHGAQTVSAFLARSAMSHGGVVLVDEAGQIGGRQMHQLLTFVRANKGRVILSGDTRQHGAVEASDALRAIEKYSTLRAIELTEIRRQDPARAKTRAEREQIAQYKQAVKEASEGNLGASFNRLDRQGAIVVCSASDQEQRLAQSYLALAEQHRSVVVVSQTWSEIHRVNDQVRAALKSRGLLGAEDRPVTALETVDLTDAQKRDRRFYKEDTCDRVEPQGGRAGEGPGLSTRGHHRQGHCPEKCGPDLHHPVPVCRSAHRMPAEGTYAGGWRPVAIEGQREDTSKPALGQWRTGHGEEGRCRRANHTDGRADSGEGLPTIRAWFRHHVLWRPRARRSIMSCSPIPPSKRPRTSSSGM